MWSRNMPLVTLTSYISNICILLSLATLTVAALWHFTRHDPYLFGFSLLFVWRYLRLIINLIGFFLYRPVPESLSSMDGDKPYKDVTVILPTIDPLGPDFAECLDSICVNTPKRIIIVTAGHTLHETTRIVAAEILEKYRLVELTLLHTDHANKRDQVGKAIPLVDTKLTVLADDHVFWKPTTLTPMIQPFRSPNVGIVAANKRVRHVCGDLPLWRRCFNMLGACYLERHNFEIRATNALDGGVFVVSGRTAALRTEILQHPDFLPGYLHEKFFFGKFGPLAADDDNFITRFVVRQGWDVKVQYTPETCVETTVGVDSPVVKKFLGQCTRWARTTWRSNAASLFTDGTVWYRQPYCAYAVYLSSFTNFAAVVDPLLIWLMTRTQWYQHQVRMPAVPVLGLLVWILLTKVVKVYAYFARHPGEIVLFPVYVAFGYFHSFIKLYALLTFWSCSWSGRNLAEVPIDSEDEEHEARETAE